MQDPGHEAPYTSVSWHLKNAVLSRFWMTKGCAHQGWMHHPEGDVMRLEGLNALKRPSHCFTREEPWWKLRKGKLMGYHVWLLCDLVWFQSLLKKWSFCQRTYLKCRFEAQGIQKRNNTNYIYIYKHGNVPYKLQHVPLSVSASPPPPPQKKRTPLHDPALKTTSKTSEGPPSTVGP